MITFNVEQPAGIGMLTLEGSFSIQDLEELKSNFIKAFQTVGKVFVNVERVSEIDISCLEFFCSVHRTSVKLQKPVTFSTIPSPFSKVVNDSGFARHVGCRLDGDKTTCLWVDGDA
jgi:ABC-type transporter Mla MlaB component